MKRIILLTVTIILFLFGFSEGHAQFYTGGNIGVHVDNKGYYFDVAPLFGYRIGRLDAGIAPFYSYREHKDRGARYSYGNRIYTQVTIIRGLYAHAEFETSNIEVGDERKWIIGLPVGAGYRQTIAPNTQAYGMVLYDVLLDPDSTVDNPIVRFGVTYSF